MTKMKYNSQDKRPSWDDGEDAKTELSLTPLLTPLRDTRRTIHSFVQPVQTKKQSAATQTGPKKQVHSETPRPQIRPTIRPQVYQVQTIEAETESPESYSSFSALPAVGAEKPKILTEKPVVNVENLAANPDSLAVQDSQSSELLLHPEPTTIGPIQPHQVDLYELTTSSHVFNYLETDPGSLFALTSQEESEVLVADDIIEVFGEQADQPSEEYISEPDDSQAQGYEFGAIPSADFYADETPTSPNYDNENGGFVDAITRNVQMEDLFPEEEPIVHEIRYKTEEPIGKGGMSLISRVFDQRLRRYNAMKVLDAKLAQQPNYIQRFEQEAQITGQLGHPNIVPVHDMGTGEAGEHFFTMKLLDGLTFKEYLEKHPIDLNEKPDIHRVVQIFRHVCNAVSYAHSRGVIHRDLKPSNIMVGNYGQVYVMDWGIAYLMPKGTTEIQDSERHQQLESPDEIEGDILGTWNYMAPEQALGDVQALGPHTDVFALGSILYEILTHTPPYQQDSIYGLLQAAQHAHFEQPHIRAPHRNIPPGLEHIVMKAMAKDIHKRYSSVLALQKDLDSFMQKGKEPPTKSYAPGSLIIEQNTKGKEAYIITKGRCRMFKMLGEQKVEIRELRKGDVFGETSIFLEQLRTASVEAIDQVELSIVAKDTLAQYLQEDTWMGQFVETLANRFVEVDQKATLLQQELEHSKITQHILHHLHTHGSPKQSSPVATWRPLLDHLCELFQYPPETILALVQNMKMFSIDLELDQVALSSAS